MIKVGVIGYGYWGPNLVRNFMECKGVEVSAVSDLREARLDQLRVRYPSLRTTKDYRSLLTDPAIDAIVIATPLPTHFDLAMEALRAGKHVLVEKPLTATAEQATQLIEEAERRKRVLMVDHTFVYNGAVRAIRRLIEEGHLGDLYYYDSVRVNLGLFRDENVIWDLAVHDLSILDYVFPMKAVAVSATGISHIAGRAENIAYLTLFFDGPQIAHLHVNWMAPVKIRRTLIGGSRKMIVYDDFEPSEKIKIYDKGVTVSDNPDKLYQVMIGYRTGDMLAPKIDLSEALQVEVAHFADCIREGKVPETGGLEGWRTVRILECAEKSMKNKGKLIPLD